MALAICTTPVSPQLDLTVDVGGPPRPGFAVLAYAVADPDLPRDEVLA